jgi:Bacterial protein of unknown function (DUF899)
MELPRIATREEWSTARQALLAKEEELAEARKAGSAERRNLPMVEFGKDDAFEGPRGTVGLLGSRTSDIACGALDCGRRLHGDVLRARRRDRLGLRARLLGTVRRAGPG